MSKYSKNSAWSQTPHNVTKSGQNLTIHLPQRHASEKVINSSNQKMHTQTTHSRITLTNKMKGNSYQVNTKKEALIHSSGGSRT